MNPECCLTVMCAQACVSYLEGEPVLAGAEPHVLHGGAVDHHLSHTLAGHKHWSAGFKQKGMGLGKKEILLEPLWCFYPKSKCKL